MMNLKLGCLIVGVVMLIGLWFGPLPAMAKQSFSAHMTLHMGVVAVAAPLLALGFADGRFDPVRWRPRWFPALPLSLLELVLVWSWHAPALHCAARSSASGLLAEQASFFTAGVLLWLAALGGDMERRKQRAASGLVALLLTSMHMTLLGALLGLTPRDLYGGAGLACFPTDVSLEDQHLGGAIMLAVGGVSYLAGGLWLTARWLRGRIDGAEARV